MTILIAAFSGLLLLAALLPLFPAGHGIVRIGDFPRQQFFAIALVLLLAAPLWWDGALLSVASVAALLAVCAVNLWHILPFTPLWRAQAERFDPARDEGEPVSLIAANVKMSNEDHGALTGLVARESPDLFILMEVDARWRDAFSGVLETYPHVVDKAQDNSYGLLLASRLALSGIEVECLLTEGVPSIRATVETAGGRKFRLFCIHPEPPVPHHETTGRDGETALVALMAREEDLPVIVSGDLNDVAWSRTTGRFRKISGLLDPRIGRKVFSTFDARWPLIRWPLDHLFHSPHFRLGAMKRLPASGSDHFPVRFDLVLCDEERGRGEMWAADSEDFRRARKHIEAARRRSDEPIGTDWED